jgi:hypothetical protein
MLGTAEPVLPVEDAVLATPTSAEAFEASDRPGANADTSAAKPAVSAAVAMITQRRVRRTRSSAASRITAARDRSEPKLIPLPIVASLSVETVSGQ